MSRTLVCKSCQTRFRVPDEEDADRVPCPSCAAPVRVPVAEPEVEAVAEGPPARQSRDPAMKLCPECGEEIPVRARKCRYCKYDLEEDEGDDPRPRNRFKPCPRCGARQSARVAFTFWGSFYGPLLFTHVKCPRCGYAYNGKTGRSNLIPAIVFVSIPLLGIVGIIGGLAYLIMVRLH